jgi:hypothetical protein
MAVAAAQNDGEPLPLEGSGLKAGYIKIKIRTFRLRRSGQE